METHRMIIEIPESTFASLQDSVSLGTSGTPEQAAAAMLQDACSPEILLLSQTNEDRLTVAALAADDELEANQASGTTLEHYQADRLARQQNG